MDDGRASSSSARASSKKSGRASSSSRTSQRSLRAGWIALSPSSCVSAIARTLASSLSLTSVRRTDANDSSSWATPCARDHKGAFKKKTRGGRDLPSDVRNWPTPVTTDAKSAARGTTTTGVMHPGVSLTDAVRMWPTPTASDYGTSGNGCPGDGRETFAHAGTPSLSTAMRQAHGGVLNPDWVETLMGFPIGWTDGPLDPATLPLFGNLRAR